MSRAIAASASLGILVLVPHAAQQALAVAQRPVQQNRYAIGQGEHNRYHHGGLRDEAEAGKPQLDAVPPVEKAAHPASLRCRYGSKGEHTLDRVDEDQVGSR